jgi:hypothetical protein
MSLINDALKKAQKMRTQDSAAVAPSLPGDGSGPVAKRARPMPARWLAGFVAGAAVLVAGSVLATVLWLRKPEATPALKPVPPPAAASESPAPSLPPPPAGKIEPAPAPVHAIAASTPTVVLPPPASASATAPIAAKTEIQPAAALPAVTTSPPESTPPPVVPPSVPPASEIHAPTLANAETRPAPPPAPVAKPDARAQAFIDALRVTGIRASGSDSKVLMNDRVFRLNDIVERTLGLRLTGVAADRLSFTDPNGLVYTRNF